MADITFSLESWMDFAGLQLHVEGYSGEGLLRFVTFCLEIIVKCADEGTFDHKLIMKSAAKIIEKDCDMRYLWTTKTRNFHPVQI
jgi:hypothetical protein